MAEEDSINKALLAAVREMVEYQKNMSRDIQQMRSQMQVALNAMKEAESEVPEKMRRFANYFHDVVHIKGEYVTLGIPAPVHIDREMERLDDRYRHLIEDGKNADGGWINKIREDMTGREGNRWDHSRLLPKKGAAFDETGNREQQVGIDKS